jgi:hypothetical protein
MSKSILVRDNPNIRELDTDHFSHSFAVGTPLSDMPSFPILSSTEIIVFPKAHFVIRESSMKVS